MIHIFIVDREIREHNRKTPAEGIVEQGSDHIVFVIFVKGIAEDLDLLLLITPINFSICES
jgi:hypothetical protein